MKHQVQSFFHRHRLTIHLIGAGGTGSQVLSGLVRLHLAMLALGHPGGLQVTVHDPDDVSSSNIGRQLFYPAEEGVNKAIALVNRCNMGFGLDWLAQPDHFMVARRCEEIFIACVDSRESRKEIAEQLSSCHKYYICDCGNGPDFGQVFLGGGDESFPSPYSRHPQLIDTSIPEDNTPSCSLAEALDSQHLFINQWIASAALQLFWNLFRHGGLNESGYYINLMSGKMVPEVITTTQSEKILPAI